MEKEASPVGPCEGGCRERIDTVGDAFVNGFVLAKTFLALAALVGTAADPFVNGFVFAKTFSPAPAGTPSHAGARSASSRRISLARAESARFS